MFKRDPATVSIEKEIFPFEIWELPEFFKQKAEVELHDTPENRAKSLRMIRDLIKDEKLMKDVDFSEDFLLPFLISKKHNVNKAFSQLKSYMDLKRRNPEVFSNFRFENAVKAITADFVMPLPLRCQDGCTLILCEIDNWNTENFPLEEVKKMLCVFILQALRYPMTQVNGFKIIYDFKISSFHIVKYLTPQNLYLLYHGAKNCAPAQYKEIHIVNPSIAFKTAWMILKHFFSNKMKNRTFIHDSPDDLLKYFPRDALPVKYGGTLENYDLIEWLRKMMQPEELEIMLGEKSQNTAKIVD